MFTVLAITARNADRISEFGFLLIALAGAIWAVTGIWPMSHQNRSGKVLSGLALAVGGVLLIIATHWS